MRRPRLSHRSRLLTGAIVLAALCVAGAAVAVARLGGVPAGPNSADGRLPPAPTIPPLTVASSSPTVGQSDVPVTSSLTVHFAEAVSAPAAWPTFSPGVQGTWAQTDGSTFTFTPAYGFPPGAHETLTIPAGAGGVTADTGASLATPYTLSFTVAPMSVLRTQELLAQLGYLPLSFTPSSSAPVPADQVALDQPGTFAWRWPNLPAVLTSQWSQGQDNVITKGAIMSFESQHQLAVDGVAGPQVWAGLLGAAAFGQLDPYGHWDWVDVTTALPETVTVWRDGAVVYQTPANTGVAGAPTALGTFPVYERFQSTTMTGTNPDGSHYSDPGVPWVSYFNGGDALHGFVRASYGFPQSDGCVEMPPANAAVVWPLTPIGTLVTVE